MTFAEKFTFRVGANNLLDKTPPIIPSGGVVDCPAGPCNGNTWAQVYDSAGSPDLRDGDDRLLIGRSDV